jgi:alginate O-acetyltransferase complex protein AlgJ
LRRGILQTEVRRGVAGALVAAFLLLIYAVPLAQLALERIRDEDSALGPLFHELPTKESLSRLENDLSQTSYAKDYVQPRVQLVLSTFGREGNEKAVIGRAGYMFYKPGITYLASPGFLSPDVISRRERAAHDAGEVLEADPRPAIFEFNAALRKRGIALVLFPVPDKAMLQPRELHGRVERDRPTSTPHSRDWRRFLAELRQHGVLVFDPTPAQIAVTDEARFLVQDTHWTPAFMQHVAAELGAFVKSHTQLSTPPTGLSYSRKPTRIARVGDIVDMLKLPEGQTQFLPQQVEISEVVDASREPFQPSEEAEVLLLGDSFSNIFSEEFMGWGSAAGLPAQLAMELQRPLDVIAQNDSGAFATRTALALELEGGKARLAKKKLVVWEFASRELAVGNWKRIDWEKAMREAK